MKKIIITTSLILVFLLLATAGCIDYITEYESDITKASYTIRYGYFINCSGDRDFELYYDCDIPDDYISTSVTYEIINGSYGHTIEDLVDNEMIRWSISDSGNHKYILGIEAEIEAQSYIVHDLNGEDALTIEEIQSLHSDKVNQYCAPQVDADIVYVDPNNPEIKTSAEGVLAETSSGNSFVVAKNLFMWLKNNTDYAPHLINQDVQTASKTCTLGTGDCDDLSILYISLCRAVKIPARFIRGILTTYDEQKSSVYSVPHAWAEVFVGGDIGDKGWIPVECAGQGEGGGAEVHQNFGTESMGHLRLFKGSGTNESLNVSLMGPRASYYDNIIKMEQFLEISNFYVLQKNELQIDKNGHRTYI